MKLTAQFVEATLRSTLLNLPLKSPQATTLYTTVTTDSRKVSNGCLFVGISGDAFDGNEFAEAALAAGAAAVLTNKSIKQDSWPDRQIYQVIDSLAAFRTLAHHWRMEFKKPVIAVAGSVGKTTTKEMIAAVLGGKWSRVLKTESSQNGFVGIPISLINLQPEDDCAVIEVGIDEVGAMIQHWNLVQPDLAIVTVTGPEHLEKLIDIDTASNEECIILDRTLAAGKKAVLNLDDEYIRKFALQAVSAGLPFTGFTMKSLEEQSRAFPTIDILSGKHIEEENKIEILGTHLPAQKINLPLAGEHNAQNVLAAISVGLALGVDISNCILGLQKFKTPPGRSDVRTLLTGQTVICDHYNANPSSVRSALRMARSVHKSHDEGRGQLWACLGDMLELGDHEETMHRKLSLDLIAEEVNEVLLVGNRMLWLEDELKKLKYPGNVRHFSDHAEAASTLRKEMRPIDTLLIKGSRGLRMERVWEQLVATDKC